MLVKSLRKTKVETLQWKREVKEWEIFNCSKSVYNWLKTCYKNSFEFLALYVVLKENQTIEWKDYEKWEVLEVSFERFNHLKSFYIRNFVFIDTPELYEEYIEKIEKPKEEKKTNKIQLKESIIKFAEENEELNVEEIKKEIKNLNRDQLEEFLKTIVEITSEEVGIDQDKEETVETEVNIEETDKVEEKTEIIEEITNNIEIDDVEGTEIKNNDIIKVEEEKEPKSEENDTLSEPWENISNNNV